MYIFDSNNKLDCSKENPNFIFAIDVFLRLMTYAMRLIDSGDLSEAKSILSKTIETHFPKVPSSLDLLETSEVFFGEHSQEFSKIYFELLELWKNIQSDNIADLTGDGFTLTSNDILPILSQCKQGLEELSSKI